MLFQSNQQPDIHTLSDEILVQQYKLNGQQRIIEELFKRYAHLLYGISLNIVKDKAESKDIVMETFAKMTDRIKEEEIIKFKPWLTTIVRNASISSFRKSQTNRGEIELYSQGLSFVEESDEDIRFYSEEIKKQPDDLSKILKTAIKDLPDGQKRCIQLFFFEKKRYKEIVAITGFSMDQVKSNLQNGKRNLKNSLTKAGVDKLILFLLIYNFSQTML